MRPPLEVYLTRRSAKSAFAPDAFVFPGGTIEPQDATQAMQARALGLDSARLAREFRATVSPALESSEPAVTADEARALLVAGLRELFEEAGVLLARDVDGRAVAAAALEADAAAAERVAVRNGELTFDEFLERHGWFADAGALALFSHWITPPTEPRRYNTHFFFAAAPRDQAALADAHETHDGIWIAPAVALARNREGTMHIVYPTIKHLQRLAALDSAERALEYARSKPVVTIMPSTTGDDFAIPQALEEAW